MEDLKCFTVGCKLLRAIFFDPVRQQEFLNENGFYQLSTLIHSVSGYFLTSPEAKKAAEEALNFLVGSAQVTRLRIEIVESGVIPVVAKLLTITNVDDIILPSLAFIYFISQEPAAKIELVDTPEVDSLHQIIQSNKPSLAAAAQECFVRLGGINILCTITESKRVEYQEFVACKTCGIVSLCMRCASVCHRDHYLSQPTQGQAICQCGLLPHCVIKERPNLRVQFPLRLCSFAFTGKNYAPQAWFICRTCFRNQQKGICTRCSEVCHRGHDVFFGGEGNFYCDCHDRLGEICKCLKKQPIPSPGQLTRQRKDFIAEIKPTTVLSIQEDNYEEEDGLGDDNEDDTCIICMDSPKNAVFYKCGHLATCMECACLLKQRKESCVICREKIEDVIRAFRV